MGGQISDDISQFWLEAGLTAPVEHDNTDHIGYLLWGMAALLEKESQSTTQASDTSQSQRGRAKPAKASVLSARVAAREGGETEFCSTRLAWERQSSTRQSELAEMVVEHAYFHSRDQIDPNLMTPEQRAAMPAVEWRMVWPNVKNGRNSLYIASHCGAIRAWF